MKSILYTQKTNRIIRFIAILAILILIDSDIIKISNGLLQSYYEIYSFLINIVAIIFFIIFFIYPQKLAIFSILAFKYGIEILLFEPQNIMGLFMFFLGVSTLYARGLYNRNRKIKFMLTTFILLCLILSEIRFGIKLFVRSLVEKSAFSFVFSCTFFFLQSNTVNTMDKQNMNNKLDIQKFPKLKKRDAQWLAEILKRKKYQAIALDEKMSLGSVKNRLKFVFTELGVGDKQGFIAKFDNFEILYGNEYSSSETIN